jgi:flagellar biosynthesis protein FliQ
MSESAALPLVEPNRGWKKLILALVAFFLVPAILQAFVPIDETMLLFVPAMAACALVGWWAGGRASAAVLWVALAIFFVGPSIAPGDLFANLVRGWTLLVAGLFGVMCLLGGSRSFFTKAMIAVTGAFLLALVMSLVGAVSMSHATDVLAAEFGRRNAESMRFLDKFITDSGPQWTEWSAKVPSLNTLQTDLAKDLSLFSEGGAAVFPALLALQSIAALALAWATYHRLSRRRLGAPLAPLREFRFNDQLVWGLIVGLVILLLPNFAGLRGFGLNLVVFFGALYAIRGLGVLAWFMKPGSLGVAAIVGFVVLWVPFVNMLAVFGFLTLIVTALGLGVGDTWADWRRRARSTLS